MKRRTLLGAAAAPILAISAEGRASAATAASLRWLINSSVVRNLTYQPLFPVLQVHTDIAYYTSDAAFVSAPAAGTAGWVMYDNEARVNPPWPTLPNEQADPATYMRLFGQLAHAQHWNAICAPAWTWPTRTRTSRRGQTNEDWYLSGKIAWRAARFADIAHFQAQSLIALDPTAYQSFCSAAMGQAVTANPYAIPSAGLSTNRGTADANVACFQAAFSNPGIGCYWMNVPGPSPDYASASQILQRCEQIAINAGLVP